MSAAASIAQVVRSALNQAGHLRAAVLVIGAAGVGRDEERQALRSALRVEDLADRLEVLTDLEIALEAAFQSGPGIVVLAGTGSVAAARDCDGQVVRQGGYGWQMGDEGGGYVLGRAALRVAGQTHDGRLPPSALGDALRAATRSDDFPALVRWAASAEPAEVAALAGVVLDAARSGDQAARDILQEAARDLAGLATGLLPHFTGSDPVPVALGGGLLKDEGYRAAVAGQLAPNPRVRLVEGPLEPVEGALALARRL